MQGEITHNIVESNISLKCIYTLVRLVNDEQIPLQVFDPFEFVKESAETYRTLQILQRNEGDATQILTIRIFDQFFLVLFTRKNGTFF